MRTTEALVNRYTSLSKNAGKPLTVARFITHLNEGELMALASRHANIEALVDANLLPLLRGLAEAEKLSLGTPIEYKTIHSRLMQLASAEYAYRRDWVLYNVHPTLTLPVSEQIVRTDIGHVMSSMMGQGTQMLACLAEDKISPM